MGGTIGVYIKISVVQRRCVSVVFKHSYKNCTKLAQNKLTFRPKTIPIVSRRSVATNLRLT